ncbi:hypothetical protein FSARC_4534 [Fusarium sarcochroum]|uniref:Uncharacterized protein n=1 Tax=Fusarium sarcochroum TaxID=1208366 RepID=A0A8H4U1K3_9HYPO|nr:hypothetical protein FSARC_4534 [Fusarium sarcochroum]
MTDSEEICWTPIVIGLLVMSIAQFLHLLLALWVHDGIQPATGYYVLLPFFYLETIPDDDDSEDGEWSFFEFDKPRAFPEESPSAFHGQTLGRYGTMGPYY